MEKILFQAKITVVFTFDPDNRNGHQLKKSGIALLNICKYVGVECKAVPFVCQSDEMLTESRGVVYELQRQLHQKMNLYNLAKLFEGFAGTLNSLNHLFEKVVFELI